MLSAEPFDEGLHRAGRAVIAADEACRDWPHGPADAVRRGQRLRCDEGHVLKQFRITDAMAAALAGFDCAATSIGFPIRNMHTISETGHTGDVLAAIHGIEGSVRDMDSMNGGKGITRDDFKNNHVRLDEVGKL